MTRRLEILLVEDNEGDVRLTREALAVQGAAVRLSVVGDGVGALAYLRREGGYAGVARPDLIFLDLNLPGRDGREVLAELKGDAGLRGIPVVVLTGSEVEADVARAYDLQANCYVAKPVDVRRFEAVLGLTGRFWLETVSLPGV